MSQMRWALVLLLAFVGVALMPLKAEAQQPAKNPHGVSELQCQSCHTNTAWKPIRGVPDFNHNTQTRFPLRGLHQSVGCTSCHVSLEFKEVGTSCSSCHADIHRRQFGGTCEDCHTVQGWKVSVQTVRQHTNRFPLVGAHATANCESCHRGAASSTFTGLSTSCISCHQSEYQSAKTIDHRAAGFRTTCETCHTLTSWQAARFDHNANTKFALAGAHAVAQCASCHIGGKFAGTSTDCVSCHRTDFNSATNPNHQAAGFPTNCASCHNETHWQGATFDHSLSRFALTGAHVSTSCQQCHVGGRFAGTPQECVSCHSMQYQATSTPNHLSAGFSQQCASCHTTTAWKGAQFDHNTTRFALTGRHTTVVCASCHLNNKFAGTSSSCASCHMKDYQAATTPNHVAAVFPQDCTTCHTTARWQGAQFDHAKTRFALTGAHVSVTCASCHVNNQFAGTSSTCSSCHMKDYQKAATPNHVAGAFPQDCTVCHTTARWQGALFDHAKTRFALTGAHTAVACATCHVNNRFAGTPQDCASCHAANYNATRNPNHAAAGFPQTCQTCHTTTRWLGATFNHNTATRFILTGAHVTVACASCHVNNRFAGTPQDCASCHAANYNATRNPNHAAAGFPQTCQTCHTTTQWLGATFNHNTATRFILTGAHVTVACASCHVNNKFAGTPQDCNSCHATAYQNTTNPNHTAAGFPRDCSFCHSTTQWKGATFNHSTTRFPLTGAHVSVTCATCHVGGKYAGLGTACVGCHLSKFNATTKPNHLAAGFPQDCSLCHSTTQWLGATFNHSVTQFPLTGAHTTVMCANCHIGGKYAGTPKDCYSCHSSEYSSVSNPNHVAAGFPKTCATCHTTTTWTGARFTHKFPIYSGSHSGKWNTCADCHTNSSNYSVFTCLSCHEHNQTSMDSKHRGIRNYAYNSTSCYGCHPQGKN